MPGLTFGNLVADLASTVRMDTTQTAENTLLERWVNQAIMDIHGRHDWPWALDREIVQTVVDKDDGTVSVSAGGQTVTGSSTAFASADVGKFIQFSSTDDWYKITAVAATDSLTIEKPYVGTSALSAGTYTIRKIFYTVSSSAEKILAITQSITPAKLDLIHYRAWRGYLPDFGQSTGKATSVAVVGQDSNNVWQFAIYPHADEIYNLEVLTKTANIGRNTAGTGLTTLTTSSDVPLIPGVYRDVILAGGRGRAYRYIGRADQNDRRPELEDAAFEAGVKRMMADCEPSSDGEWVIDSRESRASLGGPRLSADFDWRDR